MLKEEEDVARVRPGPGLPEVVPDRQHRHQWADEEGADQHDYGETGEDPQAASREERDEVAASWTSWR